MLHQEEIMLCKTKFPFDCVIHQCCLMDNVHISVQVEHFRLVNFIKCISNVMHKFPSSWDHVPSPSWILKVCTSDCQKLSILSVKKVKPWKAGFLSNHSAQFLQEKAEQSKERIERFLKLLSVVLQFVDIYAFFFKHIKKVPPLHQLRQFQPSSFSQVEWHLQQ